MSLIKVDCPMCQGTLWIDRVTGKIVDHKEKSSEKADFNAFLEKQGKDRGSEWSEKMKAARQKEQQRKQQLDSLFRKAQDDPDSIQGEYRNPFEND